MSLIAMDNWSPYRDTKDDSSACDEIRVDDVITGQGSGNPETEFATGRYRAYTLCPFVQYLDCDLRTTRHLHATGTFAPGVCVTHPMKGQWTSRIGSMDVNMEPRDDIIVYGAGSSLDFVESQPDNTSIKMSSLYIGAEFFETLAQAEGVPPDVAALLGKGACNVSRLSRSGALRSIFHRMHHNPYEGYLARLHMHGLGLAAIVELAACLGAGRAHGGHAQRQTELAEEARRFLDAHLADLPSITDLAASLGTNESSLRRAFRETFGMSLTAYARDRLMSEAQNLLREGRLQIAEIAYRSGFSDPANFTAAYRKHFGHPPSRERRGV